MTPTRRKLALALGLVGLVLAALGMFGRASIAIGGAFLLCLGGLGGYYFRTLEERTERLDIEPGRMLWE
jgi:hypothetical protein